MKVVSLLPVYLLQLCYGMNSGFTAILGPQLSEQCSEFTITLDQLSWIVRQQKITWMCSDSCHSYFNLRYQKQTLTESPGDIDVTGRPQVWTTS